MFLLEVRGSWNEKKNVMNIERELTSEKSLNANRNTIIDESSKISKDEFNEIRWSK